MGRWSSGGVWIGPPDSSPGVPAWQLLQTAVPIRR